MHQPTLYSCALLAILATSSIASAATYQYTGVPYNSLGRVSYLNVDIHLGQQVNGWFRVANPLAPSIEKYSDAWDITLLVEDFSFSIGPGEINKENAAFWSFQIMTDSRGNISEWNFSGGTTLFENMVVGVDNFEFSTSWMHGYGMDAGSVPYCTFMEFGRCGTAVYEGIFANYDNLNKGKWQRVDIAPVPIPASFPLLGASVGCLAIWRRRRSPAEKNSR